MRFKFITVVGHPFHGLVLKPLCSHMTGSSFTVLRAINAVLLLAKQNDDQNMTVCNLDFRSTCTNQQFLANVIAPSLPLPSALCYF